MNVEWHGCRRPETYSALIEHKNVERLIVQRHCIEYLHVPRYFEVNEISFSSDPTTINYEYFEVLILNW